MPGPPPKPNRQRRNRTTTAATIEAAPASRVDLPPYRTWRQATCDWWDVIWASPIADEWADADVPGLLNLAVLQDEFATTGDRAVHAEIRMASREFGLSPLSRRQLQWEVKKVRGVVSPPAPSKARSRTSSLTASVVDIATREEVG